MIDEDELDLMPLEVEHVTGCECIDCVDPETLTTGEAGLVTS